MSLKGAYQAVKAGLSTGGKGIRSGLKTNAGYAWGSVWNRQTGGALGRWATGGGVFKPRGGFRPYQGAARAGIGAARVGGTAAAADFLNPWGFGWGD
jgi:hypothetical protein